MIAFFCTRINSLYFKPEAKLFIIPILWMIVSTIIRNFSEIIITMLFSPFKPQREKYWFMHLINSLWPKENQTDNHHAYFKKNVIYHCYYLLCSL